MAEWVTSHHTPLPPPPPPPPPPPLEDLDLNPLPPTPFPPFRSGTYVVQVPKDQIYRIPPPENAEYVERHGRTISRKNPCLAFFSGLFGLLFFIFILLTIIGVAFYIAVRPRLPSLSVQKLVVKNNSDNHLTPNYEFTLESSNRNPVMTIYYPTRGHATLSYKQTGIGTGKTPTLQQEHHESKSFRLVLAGTNVRLPPQVKKSMTNNRSHVSVALVLSMRMPVKLKVGSITLWVMQMSVKCDVTASTLAKGTKIKSQDCHAKLNS
ncbi:NDR1/HIN1-like protein 13 [Aristolochia californica]|uniref:NDR1/HIN1-like protein 13 n=1 Tax=Aristolochia californica TaxID=171875 RepID=UPI0035DEFC7B